MKNNLDIAYLGKLIEEDYNELQEIGLSDESIRLSGAQSITLQEALDMGFYVQTSQINKANFLSESTVSSCLYYPFSRINGLQAIDSVTQSKLGVIKVRWTDTAKQTKSDLPKYLCLPKSKQAKQIIHYPANYNWYEYLVKTIVGTKPIFLTEGFKKSLRAAQDNIPCVALWSVWCFSEGKLNDSGLIPEIIDLIKTHKLTPYIIFDSDISYKKSVSEAQKAFANRIFLETGVRAYSIDIPQTFNGVTTKGLDEFLHIAGRKEFDKLFHQAQLISTDIIEYKTYNIRPQAPLESQPQIFVDYINDLRHKQEGSLEILSQALACSASAVLRNKITINGKKANVNLKGLAPSSLGKSTIAKEGLKPLLCIDSELRKNYAEELKRYIKDQRTKTEDDIREKPKSYQLIIQNGTREGMIRHLAHNLHFPSGLFFATGEFELFLAQLKKEINQSLSSFYTELFDGGRVTEDYTVGRMKDSNEPPIVVEDTAVSISGVSTERGFFDNLPRNAIHTGFLPRDAFYLGTDRGLDIPEIQSVDKYLFNRLELVLRYLEQDSRRHSIDFSYSPEARKIWNIKYKQIKEKLRKDPESPINSSIRRKLTDYGEKFALLFEVVQRVDQALLQMVEKSLIINWKIFDASDDIKCFFESDLLTSDPCISAASLRMALKWVDYFIETDLYAYKHFITSSPDDLDKHRVKIIGILDKHPNGINRTLLKKQAGFHRSEALGKLFKSLINELKEDWLINISKHKQSEIITLKNYLQ